MIIAGWSCRVGQRVTIRRLARARVGMPAQAFAARQDSRQIARLPTTITQCRDRPANGSAGATVFLN